MGILSNFFGVNQKQPPSIPTVVSIIPAVAEREIISGRLPTFSTDTILLENGELCHFIDRAVLITEDVVSHYEGKRNGVSFRVMRGVTYHTGSFKGSPIKEKVAIYTQGILYITDRRVIFVAKENGFEKKISAISAVMPYLDSIGIQCGSKTYNMILPSADLASSVIKLVK